MDVLKLLMVEDDPDHADVVEGMLGQSGVTVEIRRVDTVRAALAGLAEEVPDVLLLDLHLPDAQGTEAVETILAAAPQVPVVVMTSSLDEKLHLRAVRSGAEWVVNKIGLEPRSLRRDLLFALARERTGGQRSPDEGGSIDDASLLMGVNRSFQESLGQLQQNRRELRDELARLEAEVVVGEGSTDDLSDSLLELRSILDDDEMTLGRVRGIVNGLGALKQSGDPERVDLTELLENLMEGLSEGVERRAVLMTDIEDELVVNGSAEKLMLAVEHLVVNGTLAFDSGGPQDNTLSVLAEEDGDVVLIEVSDDGRGLPEGLAIERPFVSGWGRVGLGLTLAREIAEQHGGSLEWANDGRGTTFTMRLPLAE